MCIAFQDPGRTLLPKPDLQAARSIPVDPGHHAIATLLYGCLETIKVRLKSSHAITAVHLGSVNHHSQPPPGSGTELQFPRLRRVHFRPCQPHGLLGRQLLTRQNNCRVGTVSHDHTSGRFADRASGFSNPFEQLPGLDHRQRTCHVPSQQQSPDPLQVRPCTGQRRSLDRPTLLPPIERGQHRQLDRDRSIALPQLSDDRHVLLGPELAEISQSRQDAVLVIKCLPGRCQGPGTFERDQRLETGCADGHITIAGTLHQPGRRRDNCQPPHRLGSRTADPGIDVVEQPRNALRKFPGFPRHQ